MTSLYFCLYKDIFTLENLTEILKYMQELKGLPTFCYAGASWKYALKSRDDSEMSAETSPVLLF